MKNYFIIMFLIFIGCSKEVDEKDKNGIVVGKTPIWIKSTTDDSERANNFMFKQAVVYKDNVILRVRQKNESLLRLINLKEGKTLWEWKDFIEKQEFYGPNYPFLSNNKLTWVANYCNYQINLDDGKTIWKNQSNENYESRVSGYEDVFFVSHLVNRNAQIETGGNLVVKDGKSGNLLFKFKPSYDTTGKGEPNNCNWSYESFSTLFNKNDTVYSLIKFNDPPLGCAKPRIEWIGLYNYNSRKWVYQRKKLKNNDFGSITPHPSIIYKDKVYHSNIDNLTCHDLMTGEKAWETQLPQKGNYFQSAGLLVENDRVYANSDGGQLFCINAQNGNILWEIRSSGSSTVLSYLNGVVYFVGGGDGKLHAVVAETGEYLWKIESPDLGKNKSAVFSGVCAVVPGVGSEKGKIVVTTGLNAYCYEAIR
jgi:outer membrane protein assembly factor BamB